MDGGDGERDRRIVRLLRDYLFKPLLRFHLARELFGCDAGSQRRGVNAA